MFSPSNGDRAGVDNIMVLVSDGDPNIQVDATCKIHLMSAT